MRIAFALLVIVAAFAAARDWRDREVTQPPGVLVSAEPLQRDVTAAPIRVHDYTLTPRARFRLTARVLAEGIAQGVFVAHDPSKVSRYIQSALIRFCHPVLVAQHIDDDQEGALRESLQFILRSIEVERSPLP